MTAHERTVRLVAVFLGVIAAVFAGGVIFMFYIMLIESRGKDQIDPSVAAMFGTVCTIAGTSITGLAALITTTRQSTSESPVPVTVENVGAGEAVPVEPVPPDDGVPPA